MLHLIYRNLSYLREILQLQRCTIKLRGDKLVDGREVDVLRRDLREEIDNYQSGKVTVLTIEGTVSMGVLIAG